MVDDKKTQETVAALTVLFRSYPDVERDKTGLKRLGYDNEEALDAALALMLKQGTIRPHRHDDTRFFLVTDNAPVMAK